MQGLFPFLQFVEVFCKMFASDMLLMQRYMAVSSAKSLTLDLTCSFMYAGNKIGPRTEPCGTPEETGIVPEWKLFVTTDCFLLPKKFLIHFNKVTPLIP